MSKQSQSLIFASQLGKIRNSWKMRSWRGRLCRDEIFRYSVESARELLQGHKRHIPFATGGNSSDRLVGLLTSRPRSRDLLFAIAQQKHTSGTSHVSESPSFLSAGIGAGAVAASSLLAPPSSAEAIGSEIRHPDQSPGMQTSESFRYCLNTSTIRGQEVGIVEEIRIASAAGYDGIEPWIRSIRQYLESGGTTQELRKRIAASGLTVDSAIGFAQWIVDDESKRAAALDEAKRDMDLLAELGALRIAAPPAGAQKGPQLDLYRVAERYRALLEVGDETGVVPQLEVWGFSQNLARLGDAVLVAVEADHPDACLLPDVYHIFKGGSGFRGLDLLSNTAIHVFHMNDYPADPPRESMNDSHRVYPGDGIAPLTQILHSIGGHGRSVTLSLELFNRDYWQQDAEQVATTGLQKMRASVAAATSA